jgi:hypothetical protein
MVFFLAPEFTSNNNTSVCGHHKFGAQPANLVVNTCPPNLKYEFFHASNYFITRWRARGLLRDR